MAGVVMPPSVVTAGIAGTAADGGIGAVAPGMGWHVLGS